MLLQRFAIVVTVDADRQQKDGMKSDLERHRSDRDGVAPGADTRQP
jgi:hypothetical protein